MFGSSQRMLVMRT